jgi:PBP1b-binding outer membrane lipoprotein LpoB
MRTAFAVPMLFLAGCSGESAGESDAKEIANRAQSLQRSADVTTDALINQINAESDERAARDTEPSKADEASKNR